MVEESGPKRDSARRARGRPKAFHDRSEQNTIKSLDRAVTVLETLARLESATLTELAEEMSESPATLYRVLSTLEARGLTETDPGQQTWHIGPGAFLIGSVFLRRTNVVQRALPIMRELMQATGETANLGIWREARVLFVAQVETHEAIRAFFPPGASSPFHASGVGKALASQLAPDALRRLVGRAPLERFTANTIADPDLLLAELAACAARGFAIDDEERHRGMRCVAAAVRGLTGEAVAGLSVSGPVSRLDGVAVDRAAALVTEGARRLSHALGWKG